MRAFKQAERRPGDGSVSVTREADDRIVVVVKTDDKIQFIEMSEYNASRVFALIGLMLGIQLPAALGKKIKL